MTSTPIACLSRVVASHAALSLKPSPIRLQLTHSCSLTHTPSPYNSNNHPLCQSSPSRKTRLPLAHAIPLQTQRDPVRCMSLHSLSIALPSLALPHTSLASPRPTPRVLSQQSRLSLHSRSHAHPIRRDTLTRRSKRLLPTTNDRLQALPLSSSNVTPSSALHCQRYSTPPTNSNGG